jgi:hypothetical protein
MSNDYLYVTNYKNLEINRIKLSKQG